MEQQRDQLEASMQSMQEQFSEQLQRLEQHHQADSAEAKIRYGTELDQWKKAAQDRQVTNTTQAEASIQNMQLLQTKVDQLETDLNTKKDLLLDKEKEGRRMQELHLKQLRNMEKQVNNRKDASNNLGQTIQSLEVRYTNNYTVINLQT